MQQSRSYYADLLRAVSIFMVIILHNAADYGKQYGSIPISHWWAGTIYVGLSRFCVPMFVLLSGAFLLKPGKEVTLREIFLKRLPKLLIPLAAWSIIYEVYLIYSGQQGPEDSSLTAILKTIYEGPVMFHLWYLYMLTGIYLIYPILNAFISIASKRLIQYFLCIWFLTNCLFGLIEILFDLSIGFDLDSFIGYIGYFIAGYYLASTAFTARQLRIIYWLSIVAFILSVMTPQLLHIFKVPNPEDIIENDFTPDIIFAAAGLFLWMKNHFSSAGPGARIRKFINLVSRDSFGIYLVHILIMRIVLSDNMPWSDVLANTTPFLIIPLKAIVILLLSLAVVNIIRLIPVLKKIVGE